MFISKFSLRGTEHKGFQHFENKIALKISFPATDFNRLQATAIEIQFQGGGIAQDQIPWIADLP